MKMTSTLAACLGMMLASTVASAGQFYKWTDAQGTTHYTAEPPPASANGTSEVKVRTKLPSGSQDSAGTASKPKTDSKPVTGKAGDAKAAPGDKKTAGDKSGGDKADGSGKPPEQYAEKCKAMQTNLQALQEHARVKMTNDKGEVRVLSEEEKNNEIDATQREIKAFCN